MGSEGSPNSYAPNQYVIDINRDCSPEICSRNCPSWCPFAFPPPTALDDDDHSNFSPFIIALIAILATGSLFIIYYTLISRYCKRRRRSRTRPTTTTTSSSSIAAADQNPIAQFERNLNIDQLQLGRSSGGLDDGLIKSITVFKYRRGDGLIESTECAVCLNEFKEDENLRLLPNCSHAFHIPCIDAWLKSHPNCPLCRANGNPFFPTWASTSVPDSARVRDSS